jgi:type IV secretory pathway VirJ component
MSPGRGLIAALALALLSSLVAGCAETRLAADAGLGDPPGAFRQVRRMPLIEVPAAAAAAAGPLVVLYTGDDGWDKFDRLLTDRLAARGAPTATVSSLVYFLKGRSPKGAAADLAAVIAHYTRLWGRREVVLAGYSYGGDDLPLIAQALPAKVLAQVRLLVLISPAAQGDLTFRGASWFDLSTSDARPLQPALEKLAGIPILCIHSQPDPRQACDRFPVPGMTRTQILGGHHYVGHEAEMADLILKTAAGAAPQ